MHSKKFVNDSKSSDQAQTGRLFHLSSLGCKVNQAELAYLAAKLEKMGWTRANDPARADLAILMTCSVTAGAARQSRQMTRRLAKACPKALILATGCDVQAEPEAYTTENAIILGRSRLVDLPLMASGQKPWPDQSKPPEAPDQGPFCPGIRLPGNGRSRALLKVQDGCNAFCAYCIVPFTRGRPRSLPLAQAKAAFMELDQARTAEVVLTGVHLGRYGLDLDPKSSLTELVEALLGQNAHPRLRISSLEVNEISERLVDLATSHTKLCRHLHIPLQSGCDQVLRKMGRPYQTSEFARTVESLHQKSPDICLGADVLVGLPHEDAKSFKRTFDLLESLLLSYFHVFSILPGRAPGLAL
jgi:threonylcarbamoyladenosine tRNA methylthiotransferase MtaB